MLAFSPGPDYNRVCKKINISKFRENWIFYSRYVIICNGQFSHNAGGGVYVQKAAYPRHACQYGFADSIG